MTAPPLMVGLVGCGRLAEVGYLPALAGVDGLRLAAVADPVSGRRDRVAELAGRSGAPVAAYTDTAHMLEGTALDAVVLASPAASHVRDATLASSTGAAVLVEKPPAVDAAEAAQLAALDAPPWIGFNRRFDPGAVAVRDGVAASGWLDLRLEISYRRRSWRAHTVHDDALTDLGPHLVDWARWLSGGEPVDVAATRLESQRAVLDLTLTCGRAVLRAATDRLYRERIELRDAGGRLIAVHRVGGFAGAIRGRLPSAGPHPLVPSLAAQLEAFAAAVRGEPAPALGTAADGHAVMEVIDAARASAARAGRPVAVAPEGRRC